MSAEPAYVACGFALTDLTGVVDPGAWYPVVPDATWDNASIINDGAADLYVSPFSTGGSFLIVGPGRAQAIAVPLNRGERFVRFYKGLAAFYVRPVSGTGVGQKVLWA